MTPRIVEVLDAGPGVEDLLVLFSDGAMVTYSPRGEATLHLGPGRRWYDDQSIRLYIVDAAVAVGLSPHD